jgi:hypothetical protein
VKHFLSFLIVIMVFACDRNEFTPADTGLDYMPIQVGDFRIYDVNEIVYSQVAEPETLHYELRTEVVDSFPSMSGVINYVVNRFQRSEGSSNWNVLETWSMRKNDLELVVTEGNKSFVKLIFPPRAGNEWDGNEFNNDEEDIYAITEVDITKQIGELTFEKTLTVAQESNDDRIVYYDFREERYARGVGLISRTIEQMEYCTLDPCLGQQIIEQGREYRQNLIEYGRN